MGRPATLYIPDRIDEGYGPNEPAMRRLGETHDLILCVDCGTLSHGPIAAAGCDVIVLDHHLGPETLPPAFAVVNPNRQDEDGALGYLAAAAVVFLMLVAANRLMRADGVAGPDLLALLDLVALATVADVAPLVGLNRALVRQGLAVMSRRDRPGLVALAEVAGLTGAPGTYGLGFVLGPRVNAGGRIGAADLGARLLATDDPHEAAALAARLHALNAERREIEAAVRARRRGAGRHPPRRRPGLGRRGRLASRRRRHRRGAAEGDLRPPRRRHRLRRRRGQGLGPLGRRRRPRRRRRAARPRGPDHPRRRPPDGRGAQPRARAARAGDGAARRAPRRRRQRRRAPRRHLRLDGVLAPAAATPELADRIAAAGPYGAGSPAPRLAVADARIARPRRIGDGHLALAIADRSGGRLDAVAFRAFESPLGAFLEARAGAPLHLAGRLERDDWAGRVRVKLHVEDAAPALG